MDEHRDTSLEELRAEARQAILDLPVGVQTQFEKLLDQHEIVTQVIGEVPSEQRERIVPLFTALFERTWQAERAPSGAAASY